MIALSPSEQLLISSDDLCEFYYTFRVSTKRAQRNAIGVKFHHSEVSHLQCYDPSQHTGHVYICLGTLAMGDALAVEIAQQSHTNLLQVKAGCMLLEESLQYRTAIPRGPFYELLTIDDHIGLQKVPLGGPCTASFARDVEVFERAGKAYLDVGLNSPSRETTKACLLHGGSGGGDRRPSRKSVGSKKQDCSAEFFDCSHPSQGSCHTEADSGLTWVLDTHSSF